jgi:hypothetical protein
LSEVAKAANFFLMGEIRLERENGGFRNRARDNCQHTKGFAKTPPAVLIECSWPVTNCGEGNYSDSVKFVTTRPTLTISDFETACEPAPRFPSAQIVSIEGLT